MGVKRPEAAGGNGSTNTGSLTAFLCSRGCVLWVEMFKYLRRLLAQDDDNIQAICNQFWEAQATWARVGQVLPAENALYGGGTGHADLHQQDLSSLEDRLSESRWIPYLHSLSDGEEA